MNRRSVFSLRGLVLLGVVACASDTAAPPPPCTVTAATIAPATMPLVVGQTGALALSVTQSNCGTLTPTWTSSTPGVASVAGNGLTATVTGAGPGTATISAVVSGTTAIATVTVTPVPVNAVAIVLPAGTMAFTGTMQATARVTDAAGNVLTGRTVAWSTSDAMRATVSQTGLITGVDLGAVTITATVEGKTTNAPVALSYDTERFAAAEINGTTLAVTSQIHGKGGTIRVTRFGAGAYNVVLPKMGDPGGTTVARTAATVLVTAVGNAARVCHPFVWVNRDAADNMDVGDMLVQVICRNVAGGRADGNFSLVMIGRNVLPATSASGMYFGSQAASGMDAKFQWNSASTASSTSIVNGAVSWTHGVTTPTPFFSFTSLFNHPVDGIPNVCSLVFFGAPIIGYKCFSSTAAIPPVSSVFLMTNTGRTGKRWGFALHLNPTAASAPATNWATSNNQEVVVARVGPGVHRVRFAGLGTGGSFLAPLVSAVTDLRAYCVVDSWTGSTDRDVTVRCFDAAGGPVDTGFTVGVFE